VADCLHMNFAASVGVGRLTKTEGGPVTAFVADIKVNCADCGKPFQFLGLEPGFDNQGARVSLDGLEAHIALSPEGEKPNPFQRLSYNVEKFDG
jgi:hypothetical protein